MGIGNYLTFPGLTRVGVLFGSPRPRNSNLPPFFKDLLKVMFLGPCAIFCLRRLVARASSGCFTGGTKAFVILLNTMKMCYLEFDVVG